MGRPFSIQALVNPTHLAKWCLKISTWRFPQNCPKMLRCTALGRTHSHMVSSSTPEIRTLCTQPTCRRLTLTQTCTAPTRCTWILGT
uniref:Uncharacterized protein MANES_06G069200 n=1 Tax=Rhizophora mucronata TaxID=61149 RepID=A0A2P2QBD7_RHIMU